MVFENCFYGLNCCFLVIYESEILKIIISYMMKVIQGKNVGEVKSNFLRIYMIMTMLSLLFFSVLFQFFVINKQVSFYLFTGFVVFSFFYFFSTYKLRPDKYVKVYLFLGPIFNIYMLVSFWENSIGSFVSLFPVILGAYVFFDKKITLYFTIYVVFIFFLSYYIYTLKLIETIRYQRNEVIISDAFLFLYNIGIIVLLFILKERLDQLKLVKRYDISLQGGKSKENQYSSKDVEYDVDPDKANELIVRLKVLMKQKEVYKNPDVDITKISVKLDVNYSFLSKVIRLKGYNNFNHYINTYRVECVKDLLKVSDLEKITLMYIYTEAGFKNQSTFNRVFKQIEGITPSEFIKQLEGES